MNRRTKLIATGIISGAVFFGTAYATNEYVMHRQQEQKELNAPRHESPQLENQVGPSDREIMSAPPTDKKAEAKKPSCLDSLFAEDNNYTLRHSYGDGKVQVTLSQYDITSDEKDAERTTGVWMRFTGDAQPAGMNWRYTELQDLDPAETKMSFVAFSGSHKTRAYIGTTGADGHALYQAVTKDLLKDCKLNLERTNEAAVLENLKTLNQSLGRDYLGMK